MNSKTIPLGVHCGSVEMLSFFTFEGDVVESLEEVLGVSRGIHSEPYYVQIEIKYIHICAKYGSV